MTANWTGSNAADQMCGNLIYGYSVGFGHGGIRYLLGSCAVHSDAQHCHTNGKTIVSHNALATGADHTI